METGHLRSRDALLPAALLLVGAVELALLGTQGWVAAAGVEALAAGVLVLRRALPLTAPLAAVVLMTMPLTGVRMDEPATPILFYILAIYSLGRYVGGRGGPVALVVTLLLVLVDLTFVSSGDAVATDVMFVVSLAVPPYLFGRITRRLAEQSLELARQQEQLRAQAVREERNRIAREMHDVIAHSISAMVVQTAAAQDLVRSQPQRAAELLERVAETGRQALAETGRLLHLVRDESDELGLHPVPGLGDLPELVAFHRRDGLELEAELRLPDRALPGGVDMTAYRVVQEALTNAARHGAGAARLVVAADGDRLLISCSNPADGAGPPGSGLGLQGMAERVGMLGGSLRQGLSGDRFEVEAAIPLAEVTA